MKVLVTGANGFIGGATLHRLSAGGTVVRGSVHSNDNARFAGGEYLAVGDLNADTNWTAALAGMDVVIHTAARVHVMQDSVADPLFEFRKVNVAGSLNLARQAAAAGVKRLIFISSIKVNGEETFPGKPFKDSDKPKPIDPYAVSKHETEKGLREIAAMTEMEVVIIRPPLVYGPGVKANFLSLMCYLDKGLPLPLGSIKNNRRSMVALDNLVDLICTCIDHPQAANQTLLVSDDNDLSTTELLRRIGKAQGKPARLIPFPVSLLTFAALLLGKKAVIRRLCGSLQVDISKTRTLLGWQPPISIDEGLKRAAEDFKSNQ